MFSKKTFLSILFVSFISVSSAISQSSDSLKIKINFPENGYTVNLSMVAIYRTDIQKRFELVGYAEIMHKNLEITLPKIGRETIRILYNQNDFKYIDILESEENHIEITVDVYEKNQPTFHDSTLSKDFNQHILKWNDYESAYKSLVTNYFSETDKKSKVRLAKEIKNLEKEILNFKKSFSKRKDLLAFVALNKPFLTRNLKHTEEKHTKYWKKNFWKKLKLNQSIYNTFETQDWIIKYFDLYFLNSYEEDIIATGKEGINIVMKAFSKKSLGKYAYETLLQLFSQNEMRELVDYLNTHYKVDEDKVIQTKPIEKIVPEVQSFKKGDMVPEIAFEFPVDSNMNSLTEIKSEKLLLIFWSSSCPYCRLSLEKLNEVKFNDNLKVLLLSSDTEQSSFDTYKNKYPQWLHYSDFKGWNSPLIDAYKFDTTPTFIVLDKDKKFLFKTSLYDQLLNYLNY